MSVNKKNSENIKKAAAYGFSAVCGLAAQIVLILLMSAVMYALGLPPEMSGAMSFFALAAGCFVSGLVCGLIKRRGGLKTGAVCAGLILAVILCVSFISGNISGALLPAKATAALVCCAAGAVLGVNKRD